MPSAPIAFSCRFLPLTFLLFALAGAQADEPQALAERTRQIAGMLPEKPAACGAPIGDRAAWEAFAAKAGALLAEADRLLEEPTPELSDDLYLTFSRKGSRGEYEKPYKSRLHRLTVFTQAECATNRGKYLAAIERELVAILREKSWTLPAFDKKLQNFRGEIHDVDLGVSMRGATVATALSWLGDKLPADLRAAAMEALRVRLFAPYLEKIRDGSSPLCAWVAVDHNWNAVCHAGVAVAAMAVLPDRDERAEILAGVERHIQAYLSGFTADGYCSEGMVYWNYGFGHFVVLAEAILKATGEKLNLYENAIVRAVAAYPEKLELSPGVYPAFADSPLNPIPQAWIRAVCRERLFSGNLSGAGCAPVSAPLADLLLYESAVAAFPLVPALNSVGESTLTLDPLRGWFPLAGVLVSRPAKIGTELSAAISGGDNGDNHNHNDVGQFVVAAKGKIPLVDPGGELYTSRSFGPHRYESEMLNSFGHSVPVVAGQLQSVGRDAAARILETRFTPDEDRITMDISSAYAVPELQKLERTFVHSRKGSGQVEITDAFQFSTPKSFESALITYGSITRESANTLIVREGDAVLRVQVSTGDLPFETVETKIKTTKPTPPTHIGIRLNNPSTEGSVSFRISGLEDAGK